MTLLFLFIIILISQQKLSLRQDLSHELLFVPEVHTPEQQTENQLPSPEIFSSVLCPLRFLRRCQPYGLTDVPHPQPYAPYEELPDDDRCICLSEEDSDDPSQAYTVSGHWFQYLRNQHVLQVPG